MPEAVALFELVVHIIEGKEVPEERDHDKEDDHCSSHHDLQTLALHMRVVHYIVVSRGNLLLFLLSASYLLSP